MNAEYFESLEEQVINSEKLDREVCIKEKKGIQRGAHIIGFAELLVLAGCLRLWYEVLGLSSNEMLSWQLCWALILNVIFELSHKSIFMPTKAFLGMEVAFYVLCILFSPVKWPFVVLLIPVVFRSYYLSLSVDVSLILYGAGFFSNWFYALMNNMNVCLLFLFTSVCFCALMKSFRWHFEMGVRYDDICRSAFFYFPMVCLVAGVVILVLDSCTAVSVPGILLDMHVLAACPLFYLFTSAVKIMPSMK